VILTIAAVKLPEGQQSINKEFCVVFIGPYLSDEFTGLFVLNLACHELGALWETVRTEDGAIKLKSKEQ